MARIESPVPDGPFQEFAEGLRELRRSAGNPPYRVLAVRAHCSAAALAMAAAGRALPTLVITRAYVGACGGDVQEWEARWRRLKADLAAAPVSAAAPGGSPPELDPGDAAVPAAVADDADADAPVMAEPSAAVLDDADPPATSPPVMAAPSYPPSPPSSPSHAPDPGRAGPPVAPAQHGRRLLLASAAVVVVAAIAGGGYLAGAGRRPHAAPTASATPGPPTGTSAAPAVLASSAARPSSPVASSAASPAAPSPQPTTVTTSPGSPVAIRNLQVDEGTLIDFDPATPALASAGPGDPPAAFDLRVGPDNAYPENGARIWPAGDPGICAAQASSNGNRGFQAELRLHTLLAPQPGSVVDACFVTSTRRVGRLRFSSVGDSTYAPYRVEYAF